MFDVGFSELLMTGLVALLVLGPERLPKAARIAGFWLGKTRSTIANIKSEIRQELQAEEMRQLLREQQQQLQAVAEEVQSTVDDLKQHAESHRDSDHDDRPAAP
jgi:sec-independent protein translocase protein TatB